MIKVLIILVVVLVVVLCLTVIVLAVLLNRASDRKRQILELRRVIERAIAEAQEACRQKTSLIDDHLGPTQVMNTVLVDALKKIADDATGFGQKYASGVLRTHGYR
jgi:hypothetical protein